MLSTEKAAPHILCVSWDPALSQTRKLLLMHRGYKVTSALGAEEATQLCSSHADLLVLGHSVPREEKKKIIKCFREFNGSPVLSIVAGGQKPLPEVDYATENFDVNQLLSTIERIVPLD